ncbi:MAG: B12-binding domain-containing radical SAM protein [Candidatus Helarchaeota archaeon]|nr:B12-binding domain-containing radical SAM protein [Candidatus Helarchaeota archaeon]
MRIALIYPNLHGEFRPNVCILYVATYIQKESHHNVVLIDPTFHRKNWKRYILKKIQEFSPDIIGYSCLSFNFYDALQINHFLKEKYPSILSLFGGIHPTLANISTLKHKNVDLICVGEGEYTLKALLDQLETTPSPKDVKGIWYKSNGSIIKNELRPLEENLDKFPFPNWDFYEIEKYMIINPYQLDFFGSRGCPYSCTFCSNHALRKLLPGKYVRQLSPENIIQEIKYDLKKYRDKGFRYVYFWDETFILKKPFLHEFCRLFMESKLANHLTWSCTARADLLTEEDMKIMKAANCNMLQIGIEAGDPYIRNKIYNRQMSFASMLNAVKLTRKYDVGTQLNFIFGGPEETPATMQKTFKIAQSFDPKQISLNVFQPLPATNATHLIETDGTSCIEDSWSEMHNFYYKSMISRPSLTKEQINRFIKHVDRYFISKFAFRGFKERKLVFLKDLLKFVLFLKPKYNFHAHDVYKYTLRRYLYERNL